MQQERTCCFVNVNRTNFKDFCFETGHITSWFLDELLWATLYLMKGSKIWFQSIFRIKNLWNCHCFNLVFNSFLIALVLKRFFFIFCLEISFFLFIFSDIFSQEMVNVTLNQLLTYILHFDMWYQLILTPVIKTVDKSD